MLTCSDVLEAKQGTFGKRLSQVHGTVFLPTHSVIRGLPCLLKYGIIYACEVEAHMTSPGGLHLILAVFFVNHEEILGIAFNFTRDDVAPAPSITTSRSRTLRGGVDNKRNRPTMFTPHQVAPCTGVWIATSQSGLGQIVNLCRTLCGCVNNNNPVEACELPKQARG